MIREFNGKTPKVAASAWVSEAAYVVGDVEIGENSGVWPGAVIRGDFTKIRIGNNTQIEDNSVVHGGGPIEIGDNVTVGHSVVVHCRRVGDGCLIGNNATVLDDAEIGAGSVVAAGAVVTPRTKIPPRSFVVGVPAEIKGEAPPRRFRRPPAEEGQSEGGRPRGGYAEILKMYREAGL